MKRTPLYSCISRGKADHKSYICDHFSTTVCLRGPKALGGRSKGGEAFKGACWHSVGLTCLLSLQRAVLSAVRLTTSLWETRVRATSLPTHSALWPLSRTESTVACQPQFQLHLHAI